MGRKALGFARIAADAAQQRTRQPSIGIKPRTPDDARKQNTNILPTITHTQKLKIF